MNAAELESLKKFISPICRVVWIGENGSEFSPVEKFEEGGIRGLDKIFKGPYILLMNGCKLNPDNHLLNEFAVVLTIPVLIALTNNAREIGGITE